MEVKRKNKKYAYILINQRQQRKLFFPPRGLCGVLCILLHRLLFTKKNKQKKMPPNRHQQIKTLYNG